MLHIFSVLCGACQEHRRVTTALQLSTQAAPTNCSSKLPEKTQKNATRHVNTVVMGWTSLAKPDPTFRITQSSWIYCLIALVGALSFCKIQIRTYTKYTHLLYFRIFINYGPFGLSLKQLVQFFWDSKWLSCWLASVKSSMWIKSTSKSY